MGDSKGMGGGRIVQISVSRGGVPKRAIEVGRVKSRESKEIPGRTRSFTADPCSRYY